MVSAELWVKQRNLTLPGGRETLIYLLGRSFKETLPAELLAYLAENLAENLQVLRPRPTQELPN